MENRGNTWTKKEEDELLHRLKLEEPIETISKKHNMAVLFMDVQKVKRGFYEVSFKTITENPKNHKDYEITDIFIKLLEKQIINKPEHYTWTHRRFKHRKTLSN